MARSPARQAEIRAMDKIEGLMARTEAKAQALAEGLPEPAAGRVRSWFAEEYGLGWLGGPAGTAGSSFAGVTITRAMTGGNADAALGRTGGGGAGKT